MKKISQQVSASFVSPTIKDIMIIAPLMDSLDDAVKKGHDTSMYFPIAHAKKMYEVLSECGFVTIEGTNYADYVRSMDKPDDDNDEKLKVEPRC